MMYFFIRIAYLSENIRNIPGIYFPEILFPRSDNHSTKIYRGRADKDPVLAFTIKPDRTMPFSGN
jgi:hypothetical protein